MKNFIGLFLGLLVMAMAETARSQLFVITNNLSSTICAIQQYDFSGASNQTTIIPIPDNRGMTISGTNLFVASWYNGTVAEYTLSGAMLNPLLVSGLTTPYGMTVSGTNLFVAHSQGVGKYSTSGMIINTQIIASQQVAVGGITAVGTNLFVAFQNGTIGKYALDGTPVNTTLVSGLSNPRGMATDGTNIFVANSGAGSINLYTTSGSGASLITGVTGVADLSVSGTNIFAVYAANGANVIGKYSTSGLTVNSTLVSGGHYFFGIASSPVVVLPPPPAVGITTYSNQPVVIWPASGGNYILQTTTNLSSGNWVTVSNYTPMVGAMVTNVSRAAFFRLQSQ